MSAPFCCKCNATFSWVRDTICTLQLGFGQICDAEGSGGGLTLTASCCLTVPWLNKDNLSLQRSKWHLLRLRGIAPKG